MKVSVKGSNDRLTKKEIRYCLRFFSSLLIPNRILKKLTIVVNNDKDLLDEGFFGFCCREDKHSFSIDISPKLSRARQLRVLAHEMVHIKQYCIGELSDYKQKSKEGYCKWKGVKTPFSNTDESYWESPWEIDAYGREVGLIARYKAHLKDKKLKFKSSRL